jgi:NAD(P)-dependent dehydrogenase (short-subunit alcohol dehydrogenase family)
VLLLVVAPVALAAEGADSKRSNAVLVTGASTGIGRKITEQLVQLNEGQPYTYERTALIKILDDALAQARPRTQ